MGVFRNGWGRKDGNTCWRKGVCGFVYGLMQKYHLYEFSIQRNLPEA